ncbi:MAG: type II secretion system F family protein [Rubripirellula sp.]
MIPAYTPYRPSTSDFRFPADARERAHAPLGDDPADLKGVAIKATDSKGQGFSFRGVSSSAVLLTLNQVSVMTQNGIEIAEAIESVSLSCQDSRLKVSLQEIHESVTSGQSLSVAMSLHGRYFPSTLPPMLAAAEASGEVPQTLRLICHRMRDELRMRGTIVGALLYPMILIGASSVVMGALILGVLPQFSHVFESMGKPVPVYTQFLLDFGDFCRAYWLGLVTVVFGLFAGGLMLRNHPIIQGPIARFLMYGPLIKAAYRPLQAGRVLRTLAAMIHGGVPLLEAVRLTRKTTRDVHWRGLLTDIEQNLIDGLTASAAMAEVDFIPIETNQLMKTAERTGRVAEVLEDVGAFYEEEAERKIKRLVVALEPAIIVVMGVIVAGIVMSVMLPLLDVSTVGVRS